MIDQADIKDDQHQQRRSVVVAMAGARRGVERLVAEGVVTTGFSRARWSEPVAVADLRFPLATMEFEQRGNRVPESGGVGRVTVTGLRVPDPQFPTTTPGRQRLSGLGPLAARSNGGLDPHRQAGESGVGPLRWGHCPDDGCLHLLHPAAAAATTTSAGHARALCGRPLPVEGLTLTYGSAGALCMACITGIAPPQGKTSAGVLLGAAGPVQRRTP